MPWSRLTLVIRRLLGWYTFFTTEDAEYTEACFFTTEDTEYTESFSYGGSRLFYNSFYCRFGVMSKIHQKP
jgi:hypothetical protein